MSRTAQVHAVILSICAVALLGLAGCKGGSVSDPDEYRKAMKNFEVTLNKLSSVGRDASTAGDPQRLSEGLARLLPAARSTQGAVDGVKVDPSLAAVHDEIAAAAAALVTELEIIDETVKTTPLPESKGAMNAAREAFDEAVETWQTEVAEL